MAPGSEQTLHTEAYTLTLSRKLDLSEFDTRIELFSGRPVLVIERYDRTILPDGTVRRIHQEDAAQALGLPWNTDAKFEAVDGRAKLRNVARLLPTRQTVFDSGRDDRERLLAYTTFNVAVGNTDAHAKNFSTLHHADGQVALAPLYDISAHALMPDGNQNMSMRVNGNAYQPEITRDDLIVEAGTWGLPTERSKKVINETLERLRYAVEDTEPGAAGERVGLYIAAQAQNVLDGKRAAVSSTGPVSIAAIERPLRMPSR
ncbi:HipA domain-containing protein [Arthrobacter sp. H14]|uniref:HipA domain-containing protein n=1 Tax=Arthrobacter sp. H14 TaxID=1312959 RepID=UPI0020A64B4F|nr:HipA domain-containing protein [Arthrobacter sp. H14]